MAITAVQLAAHAQLWISNASERGHVALDGLRLEVGPDADENKVATIAARRIVQLRQQRHDVSEKLVRKEVARWGFRYVASTAPRKCEQKTVTVARRKSIA